MLCLYRTRHTPTETLGVLVFAGIPLAFTLEPPWKNNETDVSCIPTGVYPIEKFFHEKFGQTLHIAHVSDRTGIYFHCGNWSTDTKGCPLIGNEFIERLNSLMLVNSRITFDQIMPVLYNNPLVTEIHIIDVSQSHDETEKQYYGDGHISPDRI
mgnify:CR=1 FL=1